MMEAPFLPSDNGGYTREDDPGEPGIKRPRISVSDNEAKILVALAHGRVVLEIGTGLGVSTRALASTAQFVWTYDIDEWVRETIWTELAADLRNIGFLTEPPERDSWNQDLVFIDADHHTRAVAADVALAHECLRFGGLIVAHDSNYGSVKEALIPADDWAFIDTEHGLAVKVVTVT